MGRLVIKVKVAQCRTWADMRCGISHTGSRQTKWVLNEFPGSSSS